jgi:hypothetical protein
MRSKGDTCTTFVVRKRKIIGIISLPVREIIFPMMRQDIGYVTRRYFRAGYLAKCVDKR